MDSPRPAAAAPANTTATHSAHPRLTVRPAQPEDVPALNRLVNSAYRGESSKRGWTTEADFLGGQRIDEAGLYAILADANQRILCLVDEEKKLMATVCLQRENDDTWHLGMLTVEPTAQTGGLGKFLIAEAEADVRAWGATSLTLSVIQVRHELMAWYERRGFQRTGATAAFPYGDLRFGEPKRADLHFVEFAKKLV